MKIHSPTAGAYYQNTHDTPPNRLLVKAVEGQAFVKGARALDLGCGAGRDTRFLIENGFLVDAVDIEELAGKYLKSLPHQESLNFVESDFNSFHYARYDLINAHFSLPFNPRESFRNVFNKVKMALNPGGFLVFQLFGVNDEWNKPGSKMSFHTREQVDALMEGLNVKQLNEVDEDGRIANGSTKHWHVYHIIAQN